MILCKFIIQNSKEMKFANIYVSIFTVALHCSSFAVSAQNLLSAEKQENQTAPDTIAVQIQPIPATEITTASTEAFNLVIESGKQRLTEEEISSFEEKVDTLVSEIDVFLNDSSFQSFEGDGARELDNYQNIATIFINQLTELQNDLTKRSQRSEIATEELVLAERRWQYTLERSTEDEIPNALVERIKGIINDIDSSKTVLLGDIEILVKQLDRLSNKRNNLGSFQDRINDEKLNLGERLFRRDMPGFFADLSNLKDSTLIKEHILHIRKLVKSDVQIFKSQFGPPLILIAFIFILLLIFSFWYKNNYSKTISVDKFELSDIHLKIIDAPLLVVLFLTTFSIRLIFPDLPHTFLAINTLILIITLLIFSLRLFRSLVKSWMHWLIVIFVLFIIYELIFYPNIILRIILIILSLTAFVLFLWMVIKRQADSGFKNKSVYNLLRIIVAGFTIFLFTAIIGNLLGAFRMAEFFTLAPIQIVIFAIAILISTKVTETIIFLLLASNILQNVNVIREEFHIIYKKIAGLINLFFWIFFTVIALRIFRIKDPILEWGSEVLTKDRGVGEVDISFSSILIFIFVIWLSIFITKIVRHILEKDVFARLSTSKGMPSTIIMLVRIGLITGGFLLAAAAAGMKLTNLSIILGAFSVGIGFGLQNIFNNLVSGLILAFERPIKVGDTIQVGELMGVVLSIGFRSSTVKSFDGAEVILPNGNLISNQMINWTLSDSNRRMDIRVGVAYGTDPGFVIDLMQKVAEAHEMVSNEPSPKAYFLGFGDSSLNFRLLAWTDIDHRLSVESELYVSVNVKLAEAGIEIPFPQRDLHMKSDNREWKKENQSKGQ